MRSVSILFAACAEDQAGFLHQVAEQYLSSRECKKYRTLRRQSDRNMHLFSRVLVKHVLSQNPGIPASRVEWDYDERGHPFIPGSPSLDFSISHTGPYLALTVGRNVRVGIDIERLLPDFDCSEMARAWFSFPEFLWITGERGDLFRTDETERRKRFVELWCRKEAYGKKNGCGLSEEILETSFLSDTRRADEHTESFLSGLYHDCAWAVCWSGTGDAAVSLREAALCVTGQGVMVETMEPGSGLILETRPSR